jgi:predicted lipoprotein
MGLQPFIAMLPGALLLATVLVAGCATGSAYADSTSASAATAGLGKRLLQDYIQPGTRALQAKTGQLRESLRAYCSAPRDNELRSQVEAALGATTDAWARVELLRFGPLVEANRQENFFFWPDPRGVVQRQVRALLAMGDAAVLEPAGLRQQSAAVQGLPGLEYALFADEGARVMAAGDAAGRHRCAYASAVAVNLHRLAGEIEAGWRDRAPFALELAQPGPARSVYRNTGEVATEALKALSTALHAARDQKLVPALGATAAEARGTLLPLQRSGLTARYLAAHVQGVQDFYEAAGVGAALSPADGWIDANLRAELARIREDFGALTQPATQAVADPEQRDLLVHAALLLANARTIIDEYLAPALGVNLGFNSLDGD